MAAWTDRMPVAWRSAAHLSRDVAILVGAGDFDRADRLACRGLRRDPADQALLEQYAWSAHVSGRHAAALQRWDRLRACAPGYAMAWAGVACNAREIGDIAAAGTAIIEALARFPGDRLLLSEAHRIFDVTRLEAGRARLTDAIAAGLVDEVDLQPDVRNLLYAQAGFTCGEDGRAARSPRAPHEAIVAILDALMKTGPTIPLFSRFRGEALDRLGAHASDIRWVDPAEGHACLGFVLAHAPDNKLWLANSIDCLLKLGRLDDVERELVSAEARFPDDFALGLVRATFLAKRERWDEAMTRYRRCLMLQPGDIYAQAMLAQTIEERNHHHALRGMLQRPAVPVRHDVGRDHDAETRDLLMGFESLGEGCEFGLVQRRFGAEPLGLFRWSSTRIPPLTAAIGTRLAGLGDPEHTSMTTWSGVEYRVTDDRWGFDFHTFRTTHEIAFDKLYPKMCARLVYLRSRFLADMASADKCFIVRSDDITFDQLTALHRVLRADAPVRLVCVKQVSQAPYTADAKGGTVFEIEDGLYLAYLTRFGFEISSWNILFDEWITICRGVDRAPMLPFPASSL